MAKKWEHQHHETHENKESLQKIGLQRSTNKKKIKSNFGQDYRAVYPLLHYSTKGPQCMCSFTVNTSASLFTLFLLILLSLTVVYSLPSLGANEFV